MNNLILKILKILKITQIKLKFSHWLSLGICLTLIWSCSFGVTKIDSLKTADQVLRSKILPKIEVQTNLVSDAIAASYSIKPIEEPLPPLDKFPLYGAIPSKAENIEYIEIFSSDEKANANKESERWLVDVADKFNAQKVTTTSGKVIQVGIRNISSGIAARFFAKQQATPAGYTPANNLWLSLLEDQGIKINFIESSLVPNQAGLVIQDQLYQTLSKKGEVNFNLVLDSILAGEIKIGYPNPYSSSTGLNLLYTLLWQANGGAEKNKPLTVESLGLPQVNSVFNSFQKQVTITSVTTMGLRDIFIRDQQSMQIFPLEYQSYLDLKNIPEFANTHYISFGVLHNNPLVSLPWTTDQQREALEKFAKFAKSESMQDLAKTKGFEMTEYWQKNIVPPIPNGKVLKEMLSFWKLNKDGGRTVYMMLVIDTSGSMEGTRLDAVKAGLKLASQQINAGNYVGLITFSDRPSFLVSLAPFDAMQHKRILAATDSLVADGNTAMYDGVMVGLSELTKLQQNDPNGRFYLLLLSDGEANRGFNLTDVQDIIAYSGVRVYPIAYGEVNQKELESLAALRESSVLSGNPESVQTLLKELFQTNL